MSWRKPAGLPIRRSTAMKTHAKKWTRRKRRRTGSSDQANAATVQATVGSAVAATTENVPPGSQWTVRRPRRKDKEAPGENAAGRPRGDEHDAPAAGDSAYWRRTRHVVRVAARGVLCRTATVGTVLGLITSAPSLRRTARSAHQHRAGAHGEGPRDSGPDLHVDVCSCLAMMSWTTSTTPSRPTGKQPT